MYLRQLEAPLDVYSYPCIRTLMASEGVIAVVSCEAFLTWVIHVCR